MSDPNLEAIAPIVVAIMRKQGIEEVRVSPDELDDCVLTVEGDGDVLVFRKLEMS